MAKTTLLLQQEKTLRSLGLPHQITLFLRFVRGAHYGLRHIRFVTRFAKRSVEAIPLSYSPKRYCKDLE